MIEELYQSYNKDVYYYIYSICKNQTLSEDLTSETFYQVMLSLSSFSGKSSMKTWIFGIARNVIYKELRKRKVEVPINDFIEFNEYKDHHLLLSQIEEEISNMPELNQVVFRLRNEGYSYEEIGEKLSLNSRSIRVVQHRTRNRLKKRLERSGHNENKL